MAKEQRAILTRAARREAGIPPPTPLFRRRATSHSPQSVKDIKPLSNTQQHEDSSDSTTSSSDGEENEDKTKAGSDSTGKTLRKKGKRMGRRKGRRKLWVQCDNRSCRKWRTLPLDTVIDTTQDWFCHMHPDPAQASCAVSEEKENVSGKKRRYTFSLLEAGQLVWAKMAGFCPWPAVVSPDPWSDGQYVNEEREGRIYHVEFLGKYHTHNWIVEDKLEPYYGRECKPQLGALKSSVSFSRAVEKAQELMKRTPQQRLEKCVFQSTMDPPNTGTDPNTGTPSDGVGHQSLIENGKQSTAAPRKRRRPPKSTTTLTSEQLSSHSIPSISSTTAHYHTPTSNPAVTTEYCSSDRIVPQKNAVSSGVSGIVLPGPAPGSGEKGLELLLRSLGIPFYTQSLPTSAGKQHPVTAVKLQYPLNAPQNPFAPVINNQLLLLGSNGALQTQRKRQDKRKPRKKPNPKEKRPAPRKRAKQNEGPSTLRVDCESTTSLPGPQEEFCKLAEEAEGELKEMEDILSLLPPPPPSPPVPTAAPAQGKEEAVDRSIECVLGEMAEIEGLLQDLDNTQLVPYTD